MEEIYEWDLMSGEEALELPQPPQMGTLLPNDAPKPEIDNEFQLREYALRRSRELAFLWTPQSSWVRRFTYDRTALQLHVWFQSTQGRTVRPMVHCVYFGVDYDVFLQMVNAPSKGKFVHQVLSGYSYLQIA
jgi:hypothetical protein